MRPIHAVILALILLVLVACQPPATTTDADATEVAPAPTPEQPSVAFDAARGTCHGEVDLVAWGLPIRLELDFEGAHEDGSAAAGSAGAVTQFASVACAIEAGGSKGCALAPGRIPFIPGAAAVE